MKNKLRFAKALRLLSVLGFCISVFMTISYAVFNKSLESSATEKMKQVNGEKAFDQSESIKFWLIISLIMLAIMILSFILVSVFETQKIAEERRDKTHKMKVNSNKSGSKEKSTSAWACPQCGTMNSFQFSKCYKCNGLREEKKKELFSDAWTCPKCGSKNAVHPDKCYNCGEPNPENK